MQKLADYEVELLLDILRDRVKEISRGNIVYGDESAQADALDTHNEIIAKLTTN